MAANLEGVAQAPEDAGGTGPRRALVVAAHPDDADFGAAGTVHLWSKQGWEFYYLVCTDGSKGSDDPEVSSRDLVEVRRREQRDAAEILGVKHVYFLDYEDGELTARREFLGHVVRVIRQVKPYAVFTHDPESIVVNDSFINHSDHRITGLTAIDAVYPAARDRLNFPEQIAAGLEPHKVQQIYIWGSERANFEVDISEVMEVKVRALKAHTSQIDDSFVQMLLERWRAPDGRYLESFRRVSMAF